MSDFKETLIRGGSTPELADLIVSGSKDYEDPYHSEAFRKKLRDYFDKLPRAQLGDQRDRLGCFIEELEENILENVKRN
jgi:hypothetical protein